jgi:hypothetical protein
MKLRIARGAATDLDDRQERKGIVRVLHIKHAAQDETKFFGQK